MQAQIQIDSTAKRVSIVRARFGAKPNEVVSVKVPPGVKTLTFDMSDARDKAKFEALSKLLTDKSGPLKHKVAGKHSTLTATVVQPESAPDAKQGANKDRR
jgi:hypothetical protein